MGRMNDQAHFVGGVNGLAAILVDDDRIDNRIWRSIGIPMEDEEFLRAGSQSATLSRRAPDATATPRNHHATANSQQIRSTSGRAVSKGDRGLLDGIDRHVRAHHRTSRIVDIVRGSSGREVRGGGGKARRS